MSTTLSTPLLASTLGVMVTGILAFYQLGPRPPQMDARGCEVSEALPAASYVLVDTTDPLSANQVAAVAELLGEESAALPAGGLLSVAELGQSWNGLWSPLLEACRPPRTVAEDRSGATERGLERAYRQRFEPKLDALTQDMRAAKEAKQSPVFEAVSAAAAAERQAHVIADGPRHLVLVTDGLESVAGFPEAANARLTARSTALPFFQRIGADLVGVHVSMFYLQRERRGASRLQRQDHRDFIAAWLRERGAIMDRFIPLPF